LGVGERDITQDSNPKDFPWLLCTGGERRGDEAPGERAEEGASIHLAVSLNWFHHVTLAHAANASFSGGAEQREVPAAGS
jgi:hypothetical protein